MMLFCRRQPKNPLAGANRRLGYTLKERKRLKKRASKALQLLGYIGKMLVLSTVLFFVPGLFSLAIDLHSSLELESEILLVASLVLALLSSRTLQHGGPKGKLCSAILKLLSITLVLLWFAIAVSEDRVSQLTLTFMASGAVVLATGMILTKLDRGGIPLGLEDALLLVALLWILVPLIAALPVHMYLEIPFVNVWFESVNGMCGTGLTVFTGQVDPSGVYVPTVAELPKPILLWRAFIQWIGGIGIVVFGVAILSRPGIGVVMLSEIEGRLERIEPSIKRTASQMLRLYIALTVLGFALFTLAGMEPFDAFLHALTGVATGGFSTKSGSIGAFNSLTIELAVMLIMILGATNFYDMYKGLKQPRVLLRSPELRLMLALILLGGIAGTSVLTEKAGIEVVKAARVAFFQVTSALTTTGFQSYNLSEAPTEFKCMLFILMLVGGSIFSTAGGIKLFRILIVFKALKEELKRAVGPPGTATLYRIGRYEVKEVDVVRASLVIFLFVLMVAIGFGYVAMRLSGEYSVDNILFETISATTDIGLSTGVAGASLPTDVKLAFMTLSTLGRLEVLPVVLLVYRALSTVRATIARR